MTKTVEISNAAAIQALSGDDLDQIAGGTSQFIAACVATILNRLDPSAHCTAADHHVVCENTPQTPK